MLRMNVHHQAVDHYLVSFLHISQLIAVNKYDQTNGVVINHLTTKQIPVALTREDISILIDDSTILSKELFTIGKHLVVFTIDTKFSECFSY